MAQGRFTLAGRRLTVGQLTRVALDELRALAPERRAELRRFVGLAADYGATTWQRQDGWLMVERLDALDAARYAPAEPGDVRFEVGERDEDGYQAVLTIDDEGAVVDRDYMRYDAVGAFVAGHREAQDRRARADELGVHPLELAFAPFGEEWQREQEERLGGGG